MNSTLREKIVNHWQLYICLIIPVAYIIIFAYVPMVGVQIAFKEFNPVQGIFGSPWIGIENFTRFLNSYQFFDIIRNTLTLSIYSLIAGFPIPVVFALILNSMRSEGYRKTIQMVTYAPHFISTVVLIGMIVQYLNPIYGFYGTISNMLGVGQPKDLLGEPSAFPHLYVWSGIWQQMGWSSIIYISALAAVDQELHEAMQIDGATRFQRMRLLELPTIIPTATILLILSIGNIMNVGFEKVILMQNNMNVSTSEVIATYVYKIGLTGMTDFSFSSAIGLFNSLINFILLVTVNSIVRRKEGASIW